MKKERYNMKRKHWLALFIAALLALPQAGISQGEIMVTKTMNAKKEYALTIAGDQQVYIFTPQRKQDIPKGSTARAEGPILDDGYGNQMPGRTISPNDAIQRHLVTVDVAQHTAAALQPLPTDKQEQLSLLAGLNAAMDSFDAAQASGSEADIAAARAALRDAATAMQAYAGGDETSTVHQTAGTILRALDAAAVLDGPANDAKTDEAITAFAHAFAALALADAHDASPEDKAAAFFAAGEAGDAAAAVMEAAALAAAYNAFMAETDGKFVTRASFEAALIAHLEAQSARDAAFDVLNDHPESAEAQAAYKKADDDYNKAVAAHGKANADYRKRLPAYEDSSLAQKTHADSAYYDCIAAYADAFAAQYADAFAFAETFHLLNSADYAAAKQAAYRKAYDEAHGSFYDTYANKASRFGDIYDSLYDDLAAYENLPTLLDTLKSAFIDQHDLEGYGPPTLHENVTSLILADNTTAVLSGVHLHSMETKNNATAILTGGSAVDKILAAYNSYALVEDGTVVNTFYLAGNAILIADQSTVHYVFKKDNTTATGNTIENIQAWNLPDLKKIDTTAIPSTDSDDLTTAVWDPDDSSPNTQASDDDNSGPGCASGDCDCGCLDGDHCTCGNDDPNEPGDKDDKQNEYLG